MPRQLQQSIKNSLAAQRGLYDRQAGGEYYSTFVCMSKELNLEIPYSDKECVKGCVDSSQESNYTFEYCLSFHLFTHNNWTSLCLF